MLTAVASHKSAAARVCLCLCRSYKALIWMHTRSFVSSWSFTFYYAVFDPTNSLKTEESRGVKLISHNCTVPPFANSLFEIELFFVSNGVWWVVSSTIFNTVKFTIYGLNRFSCIGHRVLTAYLSMVWTPVGCDDCGNRSQGSAIPPDHIFLTGRVVEGNVCNALMHIVCLVYCDMLCGIENHVCACLIILSRFVWWMMSQTIALLLHHKLSNPGLCQR